MQYSKYKRRYIKKKCNDVTTKMKLGHHKEEMFYPMYLMLRMSRAEKAFVYNVYSNNICHDKPLSEKQANVFENIVGRYRTQLANHGIQYTDILNLPWLRNPLTENELHARSYLRYNETDDTLRMFFRYDNNLIELVHRNFEGHWNKDLKQWIFAYSMPMAFKLIKFALNANINIQGELKEIAKYCVENFGMSPFLWGPSLHVSNGRFYICNITESMDEFIQEQGWGDISDVTVYNAEKLISLGLQLAPGIYDEYRHILTEKVPSLKEEDMDLIKMYAKETNRQIIDLTNGNLSDLTNGNLSGNGVNKFTRRSVVIDKIIEQYNHPDNLILLDTWHNVAHKVFSTKCIYLIRK